MYNFILKINSKIVGEFKTLPECEDHFNKHKWGEEEKTIIHPAYEIPHEEIPAVLDQGVEISPTVPAWIETIPERIEVIPCEYVKEIIDNTAQEETERVKKETKKLDRVSRVDQLKAINWNLVTTFNDQQKILKLLVKEAIKDDE